MESTNVDNEGELTSTMGNVMQVSSNEEKNDTSDATPTSSTDANTFTTTAPILSDDPISSTSSDSTYQVKLLSNTNEPNSSKVLEVLKSSADNETDILDIANIPSEKITEDVEDLVHDLESLLGEPAPTFVISSKQTHVKENRFIESQQSTKVNDTTGSKNSEVVDVCEKKSVPEEAIETNPLEINTEEEGIQGAHSPSDKGDSEQINESSSGQQSSEEVCQNTENIANSTDENIPVQTSEAENIRDEPSTQEENKFESLIDSLSNEENITNQCIQDQDITRSELKEKDNNIEPTLNEDKSVGNQSGVDTTVAFTDSEVCKKSEPLACAIVTSDIPKCELNDTQCKDLFQENPNLIDENRQDAPKEAEIETEGTPSQNKETDIAVSDDLSIKVTDTKSFKEDISEQQIDSQNSDNSVENISTEASNPHIEKQDGTSTLATETYTKECENTIESNEVSVDKLQENDEEEKTGTTADVNTCATDSQSIKNIVDSPPVPTALPNIHEVITSDIAKDINTENIIENTDMPQVSDQNDDTNETRENTTLSNEENDKLTLTISEPESTEDKKELDSELSEITSNNTNILPVLPAESTVVEKLPGPEAKIPKIISSENIIVASESMQSTSVETSSNDENVQNTTDSKTTGVKNKNSIKEDKIISYETEHIKESDHTESKITEESRIKPQPNIDKQTSIDNKRISDEYMDVQIEQETESVQIVEGKSALIAQTADEPVATIKESHLEQPSEKFEIEEIVEKFEGCETDKVIEKIEELETDEVVEKTDLGTDEVIEKTEEIQTDEVIEKTEEIETNEVIEKTEESEGGLKETGESKTDGIIEHRESQTGQVEEKTEKSSENQSHIEETKNASTEIENKRNIISETEHKNEESKESPIPLPEQEISYETNIVPTQVEQDVKNLISETRMPTSEIDNTQSADLDDDNQLTGSVPEEQNEIIFKNRDSVANQEEILNESVVRKKPKIISLETKPLRDTSKKLLKTSIFEPQEEKIETKIKSQSAAAHKSIFDPPSETIETTGATESFDKAKKDEPKKTMYVEPGPLELSEESDEEIPTLQLETDSNGAEKELITPEPDPGESTVVGETNLEEDKYEKTNIQDSGEEIPMQESVVNNDDIQENLETILAVASLQNIVVPRQDVPILSDKERREMEALRMAVASITEPGTSSYDNVDDLVKDINIPDVASQEIETVVEGSGHLQNMDTEETTMPLEDSTKNINIVQNTDKLENDSEVKNTETELQDTSSDINLESVNTEDNLEDYAKLKNTKLEIQETLNQIDNDNLLKVVASDNSDIQQNEKVCESREITSEKSTEDIVTASTESPDTNMTGDVSEQEVTASVEKPDTDLIKTVTEQVITATKESPDTNLTETTISKQVMSVSKESPNTNFTEDVSEPEPTVTVSKESLGTNLTENINEQVGTASKESPNTNLTEDVSEPVVTASKESPGTSLTGDVSEQVVTASKESPDTDLSDVSEQVVTASKESPDTDLSDVSEQVVTASNESLDNNLIEDVIPDSSETLSENEVNKEVNEIKDKVKSTDRNRRHKRSVDKIEELSINVDVTDKDKSYSPKITIKPIKVPDEEVSTTSNSDSEIGKGTLKMTITKQSDKMHTISKMSDSDHAESSQESDEPVPKLKIKSKGMGESPQKMSTRSSKQTATTSIQRSGSPRITIKPVVKPEKQEHLGSLKIKIGGLKSDDTGKKHSPKLNIKPITKQEEEPKEPCQSPRKVSIKPIVKNVEEIETTPRITIKPIPKPELEKESLISPQKLNIKPIKKPDEEEVEAEKERSSPKITIKPIVKPAESEVQDEEVDDEVKKRIVLKINKGTIPSKDVKKKEHVQEDDKLEKLAKITLKISKEGGHHIVQPSEEPQKRPIEETNISEKNKKQKIDGESVVSTRSKHKDIVDILDTKSRHKEASPVETKSKIKETSPVETRLKHKDVLVETSTEVMRSRQDTVKELLVEGSDMKLKDNPMSPGMKHKDSTIESPIEPKRIKLRDSRQKENVDKKSEEDEIKIMEQKLDSPIIISEDSISQDSGSCVIIDESLRNTPVLDVSENVKPAVDVTPPTPTPRKRGRPRKVPLEVRQEFKEQDDPSADPKTEQSPRPVHESGRPKRSCRGQSALDTLGLKPRKPRGPGRGRGSARGMGSRSIPMKPEKEPKVSKAKLKLMQRAAQAQLKQAQREAALRADKDTIFDIEQILPQSILEKHVLIRDDAGPSSSEDRISHKDIIKNEFSRSGIIEPDTTTESNSVTGERSRLLNPVNPISRAELFKAVSSNSLPSTERILSEHSGLIERSFKPTVSHAEAMLVSEPILPLSGSPKFVDPEVIKEFSSIPESTGILQTTVSSTTGPAEVVMVDEETRMSADNSRAQTPAKQVNTPMDVVIEESQSSVQSTATTESGKASRPSKAPRLEVQEPEGAVLSADQLTEYYWNGNGPFMIQEQVAQFLGIKSFKRKYPSIKRRMVDMQERDFIKENGLVSEHMCDLGLTAVNSADILDIMYADFQEKYEEYCKNQRDKQAKELINKQKALFLAASQDKTKDITEQAVRSAAQWNANFNKTRKDQRRACMDLQTLTVHYPKGKVKKIDKNPMGSYPVSLVPGQFTDYYQEFTPTEINNLPLNTMCYNPINIIPPDDSDDSASDGSSSDSDSSTSSSGSDSDSSSGVEDCKLCKHSPKKIAVSK